MDIKNFGILLFTKRNTCARINLLDKLEVVGECDGKEIVRNDFGRTVAVIPYIFNRTSILLARMVF